MNKIEVNMSKLDINKITNYIVCLLPFEINYEIEYDITKKITIRNIIELMKLSEELKNPNKYNMMWYYDENGKDVNNIRVNYCGTQTH